ncbi:MAG: zinc ribbon domain-containing protein [Clostridiales bacterium]|nr:zinc ribbon domain-containing protein [Clostridiales bacterium]
MPFYDLRCPVCNKEFNIYASMADKAEKRISCSECGSHDLETVFKSAPAYIKSRKNSDCPSRHICGEGCRHAG